MNETIGRRVFVGSLAGAGVGAVGATLLDLSLSAQPTAAGPVVREVRRQLREGMGKLREGRPAGARQLAAMLRVYASAIDEGELRAVFRKVNRRQLRAPNNHGEMVRQAQELGLDPSRLPPHAFIPQADREQAFAQLLRDGLGASMRSSADLVDDVAEKLEDLVRRPGGAQRLQIALMQPVPEPRDCGNCEAIKGGMNTAALVMDTACGIALLFPTPPTEAACAAAIAAFLVMLGSFGACQAIIQLCEAYYDCREVNVAMQVLVLVMVVVGAASVMWFAKRPPSRARTFAAVATFVGSIFIMAMPQYHGTPWFYMAAVLGTIAMAFLLTRWLRPRHRTA